ncbi:hypothetical protein SNEBB_009025 [Seison nebaliae]|nr:hypothetical protein SNEBB_009025 [Seison nebaliae]
MNNDVVYVIILLLQYVYAIFFIHRLSPKFTYPSKLFLNLFVGFCFSFILLRRQIFYSLTTILIQCLIVLVRRRKIRIISSYANGFISLFIIRFYCDISPLTNVVQLILTLKLISSIVDITTTDIDHENWNSRRNHNIVNRREYEEEMEKLSLKCDRTVINEEEYFKWQRKHIRILSQSNLFRMTKLEYYEQFLYDKLSFLELISYYYSPIGLFSGPFYRLSTYRYSLKYYYSSDERKGEDEREIRKRFFHLLPFALTYIILHFFIKSDLMKEKWFIEQSIFFRLIFTAAMFLQLRARFYCGWVIAEMACIKSGIGTFPQPSLPKSGFGPQIYPQLSFLPNGSSNTSHRHLNNYETCENMRIEKFEMSLDLRSSLRWWNMTVQWFFSFYVYRQLKDFNELFAIISTMTISAFWHGLHIGYYIGFLQLIPLMIGEDMILKSTFYNFQEEIHSLVGDIMSDDPAKADGGAERKSTEKNERKSTRNSLGVEAIKQPLPTPQHQAALPKKLTKNLIYSVVTLTLSSFIFGYNIGCMNPLSGSVQDFMLDVYRDRNNTFMIDNMDDVSYPIFAVAMFVVGGFIGAFLGSYVMNMAGRRLAVFIHMGILLVGSLCQTIAKPTGIPEFIYVGRFIVGLHGSLACTIIPTYLQEISPINYRGNIGSIFQLQITVGILISSILGIGKVFGTVKLWPYAMNFPIPIAIICIIMMLYVPETPPALYARTQSMDKVEKSLRFFRGSQPIDDEVDEIKMESARQADITDIALCQPFIQPQYRPKILIAATLHIVQQLSGINAIMFYSGKIYSDSVGLEPDSVDNAIIIQNSINVLATVVSSFFLMNRLGRRTIVIWPLLATIFVFIFVMVFNIINKDGNAVYGWISIILIVLYVVCFAVGLGPVPFLYMSEIFSAEARSATSSICVTANYICNALLTFAFPSIQSKIGAYVFIIFMVICAIGFVVLYFKMVETKDRTLEDIDKDFGIVPAEGPEATA